MDIICKEKYNVIFWRNSRDEEWNCEDLDVIINAYQDEPYCELNYWTAVHPADDEEKDLYYLWICDRCEAVVPTLDMNHDLEFCPHCGRAILK